MTIRILFIGSLIAGVLVGAGITWGSFGRAGTSFGPAPAGLPLAGKDSQQPRLAIAATTHDFGTIDRTQTARHAFRISNHGPGLLKLKAGKTTCSACTIALLDKQELATGETANVVIEYSPAAVGSKFRQTATVLTNDPQRPRIELTVLGKISSKLVSDPPVADFGNVPAGEIAHTEVSLLYFLAGDLRVVNHAFTGKTNAENFSLEVKPIARQKVVDRGAGSGAVLVLSLKPGLPLGQFTQTIQLTLDSGEGTSTFEYTQAVRGTIVSDISIVGAGWRATDGVLDLGTFKQDKGTKKSLRILVRGDDRRQIELRVLTIDPPQARATLGDSSPLNEKVQQIPLEIEIPPGMPPTVRNGSPQAPLGEIVLGVSNYPHIKELKLRLKLTIE